jgi:hypothetical protein
MDYYGTVFPLEYIAGGRYATYAVYRCITDIRSNKRRTGEKVDSEPIGQHL